MLSSSSCSKIQGHVADNKPCQPLSQLLSQPLGKVQAANSNHGICRPGRAAGILDPAKQELDSAMCRITPKTLADAIHELNGMSVGDQKLLTDEIFRAQPNLLASVLVLSSFDVHVSRIEFALRLLLLIFLSMKRSGHTWPIITEDHQAECFKALTDWMFDSEKPKTAHELRVEAQRSLKHPEKYLFAHVLSEARGYMARRPTALESDKFIMFAVFNLVECIARPQSGELTKR